MNTDPKSHKKKCLVLGGAGFIGSNLINSLILRGYIVRSFDSIDDYSSTIVNFQSPNFEIYKGDFNSEIDLSNALRGCDICYHLISTTLPQNSNLNPIFDVETNLISTLKLLDLLLKIRIEKLIFTSSGGTVYGRTEATEIPESHPLSPICSYGIIKATIEKYLALFKYLHGLDYAVLRIANPYGYGQKGKAQGALNIFLEKALRGDLIEVWGDGSIIRDYVYISDVVEALVLAIDDTHGEFIFNIGSGSGSSINEILSLIERSTGKTLNIRREDTRNFDVQKNVLSIELAKKFLNWSPSVTIAQGIELTKNKLLSNTWKI